jgi:hypothetical protein
VLEIPAKELEELMAKKHYYRETEPLEMTPRGVAAWNRWKSRNPHYSLNLSGHSLCGAYLEGANLRGANLAGADLKLANLRRAKLELVDLDEADLSRADLVYCV